VLLCRADPAVIRARLAARHGDVSDADWGVYEAAAARWQEPGPRTRDACEVIETDAAADVVLSRALERLAVRGLWQDTGEPGM
jgi:uncharacterized protein